MIRNYKEKAPQFQAVEVTDALNQLAEVANMIGAKEVGTTFNGDGKRSQVLKVGEGEEAITYTVIEGQVITLSSEGAVAVLDAADFYSKYEVI